MPSPLQTRLRACLVFYLRVSLCILWWTIDSVFFSNKSNQDIVDTTCNTSIDDTVKFVFGDTEAFMEISRGKLYHQPEDLNISRTDR